MRDGFKVIDADAHFYEPIDIWDKYLEPPYIERMPKIARVHGKAIFEYEGGKMHTSMHSKTLFSQMEAKFGHAYHDNWSLESRLKDMDEEGWDIQVCLPTNGGRGSFESDPGMAAATVAAPACRCVRTFLLPFFRRRLLGDGLVHHELGASAKRCKPEANSRPLCLTTQTCLYSSGN